MDDTPVEKKQKRSITHSDEIAWVAKKLQAGEPLTTEKANAPTPAAFNLLSWAKSDAANEKTFWASIWPQLARKEKQEDRKDVQKDDQRTHFRLFASLERERPDLYRRTRAAKAGKAPGARKPAALAAGQAEVPS